MLQYDKNQSAVSERTVPPIETNIEMLAYHETEPAAGANVLAKVFDLRSIQ